MGRRVAPGCGSIFGVLDQELQIMGKGESFPHGAQRLDAARRARQGLQARRGKGPFRLLDGVVHEFVDGAQALVTGNAQGTFVDALRRRIDGVQDVEDRDVRRLPRQYKPAVQPPLRRDQPAAHQLLENLGQIPVRDQGPLGDQRRGLGGILVLGQKDGGAQSVFSGGVDHDVGSGSSSAPSEFWIWMSFLWELDLPVSQGRFT